MSDKKFDSIDALVADIEDNYLGAELPKPRASTNYQIIHDGIRNGKYRVASVGSGTAEYILRRLMTQNKAKLVYLILEESNE